MENKYLNKLSRNIKEVPDDYDTSLDGLGGWMMLIIIGRVLAIIIEVAYIPEGLSLFGYDHGLDVFLTISLAVLLPIEVIVNIVILFKIIDRNILFRKFFVIYAIFSFAFVLATTIYMTVAWNSFDWKFMGNAIGAVIWILYLYQSSRVRNTFIYPYMDFEQDDEGQAICVQDIEL